MRTYFTQVRDVKTRFLQARIRDFEIIVTHSELEALLLENNLIKRWKPRFNINLKDGKTYPVIKLTREEYPRVYRTRRIVFDGSEYFGPYPDVQAIDVYLDLIERLFPLRNCRGTLTDHAHPCLNYSIGRCSGICAGKISREEYLERVEKVRRLLSGQDRGAARRPAAADGRRPPPAWSSRRPAATATSSQAIEGLYAEQQVVDFVEEDRDYLGLWTQESQVCITLLQMRNGKMVGREIFEFEDYSAEEEVLSQFLGHYYGGHPSPLPRTPVPLRAGRSRPCSSRTSGADRPRDAGALPGCGGPGTEAPEDARRAAGRDGPPDLPRAAGGGRAGRGGGRPGPAGRPRPAGAAAAHRGVRHRPPGGAGHRGLAGGLRRRAAAEEGLPALQGPHPAGQGGRLRGDARGGGPPLHPPDAGGGGRCPT